MERFYTRCLPIVFTLKTILVENVLSWEKLSWWKGEVGEVDEVGDAGKIGELNEVSKFNNVDTVSKFNKVSKVIKLVSKLFFFEIFFW